MFITGGAGSGKSLLAFEMVARAWLEGADGTTCLYYSVEQSPDDLHMKLVADFDCYGYDVQIKTLPREVQHTLCLEIETEERRSRLVITQANPANLQRDRGPMVDLDWIHAEIGNYRLTGRVHMVCIDNVGLLVTDLDYYQKRRMLLETRRLLMAQRIHGIFVQEEVDPRSMHLPSAEEFSTDLLIRLSFMNELGAFKARSIEIQKARHQYYYRGQHHFSIAGRGIQRDVYLGARNERGPGIHIYPSVAAQLSIARDSAGFHVPSRGDRPLDLGHPDINAAFLNETGPTHGSSTVLIAEPGTRYTFLAMRFLAAAHAAGEDTMMVSTKEDPDALARLCQRESALRSLIDNRGELDPRLRMLYLHPEFISAGKFTWDLLRVAEGGHFGATNRGVVTRMVFDNIYRLHDRFPLIDERSFMVPALLDLLRYRNITPLFIDLVPPGSARGRADFNPSQYMTTFDNVLHLFYLDDAYMDDAGENRPLLRILKSTANDFRQTPAELDYRRMHDA